MLITKVKSQSNFSKSQDHLSDPEGTDDFLTSQDIDGQEILKAAAENKRIKYV